MKYVSTQASFKSGRLSEKLQGRVDVNEYQTGLSVGENGLISKSGGAFKRYGINKMSDLPASLASTFGFNASLHSYSMFGDKVVHLVLLPASAILIDVNGNLIDEDIFFTGSFVNAKEYSTCIYENKIFIVHYSGVRIPYVIEFELNLIGELQVKNKGYIDLSRPFTAPMADMNIKNGEKSDAKIRVMEMGGDPGGGTPIPQMELHSDVALFEPSDVGRWVMLNGIVYFEEQYGAGKVATAVTGYYRIDSIDSPTRAQVVSYTIYKRSSVGYYDIMTDYIWDGNPVVDSTSKVIPESNTSEWIESWHFSAWNPVDGYPKLVSVDEGRLIYSGTKAKPNTFFGSMIGDPFFFLDKKFRQEHWSGFYGDISELDPIQFTIAAQNDSAITFMQPASSLIIGTFTKEYIVSGNGGTISKKNISVRPHTAHGSKPVLSAVYDANVFYVGTSGKQLFLLRYSEENGSFVSKEVSILFDDLLEDDAIIVDIAFNDKLGCLFIVLSNGRMITMTVNTETGTLAPMTHTSPDVDIVATSYSAYPHATRQNFLYIEDGRLYLGKLTDEEDPDLAPEAYNFNLNVKSQHGDLIRHFNAGANDYAITYINHDLDYIRTNDTDFLVGDAVIFLQDGGGSTIETTNITKGQVYYAIPYINGDHHGIRLALTEANAIANIFIDITRLIVPSNPYMFIGSPPITLQLIKKVRKLPIKNFPVGSKISVMYLSFDALEVNELSYTKQAGDEYIDLGFDSPYAFYGNQFEFHIATMPMEAGQQWGSSQLGIKRPDKISVRYYRSYGFLVGTDGYNEEEIIVDDHSTGRAEVAITANSEYDSIIHIRNTKFEPCYIINMTIRGLSNDG